MADGLLELFPRAEPRGSAQCPTCGKFCKIVAGDGPPLIALEDSWAEVECPKHGRGEV